MTSPKSRKMASNEDSRMTDVQSSSVHFQPQWVETFIEQQLPASNENIEDDGAPLTWEDLLSDHNFLDMNHPDSPTSARLRQIARRYRSRVYEIEEDMAANDDHVTNFEHANMQLADHVSKMATRCVIVSLQRDTYAASMRKYCALAVGAIVALVIGFLLQLLKN